eukprot:1986172-Pyramimonas_sp.AAC.1
MPFGSFGEDTERQLADAIAMSLEGTEVERLRAAPPGHTCWIGSTKDVLGEYVDEIDSRCRAAGDAAEAEAAARPMPEASQDAA